METKINIKTWFESEVRKSSGKDIKYWLNIHTYVFYNENLKPVLTCVTCKVCTYLHKFGSSNLQNHSVLRNDFRI